MNNDFFFNMMGSSFGGPSWAPGFFLVIMLWTLFWKGLALWHSSRRGQGWWFLALLLINTMGILEIVYLFAVAKVKTDQLIPMGKKK